MLFMHGPHRLVVRTSRRGRDNPGSNPDVDRRPKLLCQSARGTCLVTTIVTFSKVDATTKPSTCFHQKYSSDRPRRATLSCTLLHQSGNLKKQPLSNGRPFFLEP